MRIEIEIAATRVVTQPKRVLRGASLAESRARDKYGMNMRP
jgi:hypothetical protein